MKIFNHETEIELTHNLNDYELNTWIKHLQLIKKEIISLEKMWNLDLDEDLGDDLLQSKLEEIKVEIKLLFKRLSEYVVVKPNDIICEDYQCDVDLITEHENYRNRYLEFLKGYRNLKNSILRMIQGKPITNELRELRYG